MAKGGQVTRWAQGREVREMRDADTILTIIRERGGRGLPLEDVYRQLYNPALYLRAYGRIYRNDGAMTRGNLLERARHRRAPEDLVLHLLGDERRRKNKEHHSEAGARAPQFGGLSE